LGRWLGGGLFPTLPQSFPPPTPPPNPLPQGEGEKFANSQVVP
jgi:hypothetical protein